MNTVEARARRGAGSLRYAALGLALAVLVLGSAYALAVPAGEAPDEPAHLAYVNYLLERHALPPLAAPPYGDRYESYQAPLDYLRDRRGCLSPRRARSRSPLAAGPAVQLLSSRVREPTSPERTRDPGESASGSCGSHGSCGRPDRGPRPRDGASSRRRAPGPGARRDPSFRPFAAVSLVNATLNNDGAVVTSPPWRSSAS